MASSRIAGLLCAVCLATLLPSAVQLNQTSRQALKEHLLGDYDPIVMPVVDGGLQVEVEFVLMQFIEISTKYETVEMQGWLRQYWDDPRLSWDENEFDVPAFHVPIDQVWRPDIVMYEAVEEEQTKYGATVYSSGRVFFASIAKVKIGCKMDIRAFPYDRQNCNFTIGSWSHNGLLLDVAPRLIAREPDSPKSNRSAVDLSVFEGFQEWKLVTTRSIWKDLYYTCCPEPFPVIIVELEIHRATRTYFSGMIAPIVLVTLVSFFVLLMPSPTSGARPALSVTLMLTIATVYFVASQSTPMSNDSTMIGRLYLVGILCSFVLVLASIISTGLNLINDDNKLSQKRLTELFKAFDKSESGELNEEELEVVLAVLNVSAKEKAEILEALPQRRITKHQWFVIGDLAKKADDGATFHNKVIQWMVQWAMRRRMKRHPQESDSWSTFKRYFADGSGGGAGPGHA